MTDRPIGLVGVPSSAGAFAPGQEAAPRALRDAGLVSRLEAAGLTVVDHGDTDAFRWRPDPGDPYAQNLDAVVRAVEETARRVEHVVSAGQSPLVLGGDCTVGLGTIAGSLSAGDRLGVVYFDLHPDLNVPTSARPGALDWMGMAHALGVENTAGSLRRVGPRVPLLADDQVHFFGYGPDNRTDWERDVMRDRDLAGTPVNAVADGPVETATTVLSEFCSGFDRFLVHFDVDVVDFTDLPLSENAGRNEGLPFEGAMDALNTLVGDPRAVGLTVTEINPAHGDPSGATVERFVDAFSQAAGAAGTTARSV